MLTGGQSLAANVVHFQNIDGDIEGVFDVAQALDLASETGKIECRVDLRTRGAELYPNSSMQLFSRHGCVLYFAAAAWGMN
jgi:hypothetical protein